MHLQPTHLASKTLNIGLNKEIKELKPYLNSMNIEWHVSSTILK